MAKKARKKSAVKARKVKRAKAATKTRNKTKAKSKTSVQKKTAVPKKPARKSRRTARPKGIADRVAGVFHTAVDTVRETDALRNKMEPPGTSETE